MTGFSNIYFSPKSSKLLFAITLVLSLFACSGYINPTLLPKAQASQTELVAIPRQHSKTITLSKVVTVFIKKAPVSPVSFYQLIHLHDRLVNIRLAALTKSYFSHFPTTHLLPIKTIPTSAEEAIPAALQG